MIVSAKEFIREKLYTTKDGVEDVHDSLEDVSQARKEFARLHVQEALKQAFLNSTLKCSETATSECTDIDRYEDGIVSITINATSVTEAYPPENIK